MSYLPFRDNPDARIPNLVLRDQLVALAEQIDLSSRTSAHEDSCGCKDGPQCTFRSWHENHEADTAEALAWMWNKGLLHLPSHLSEKPTVSEDQPKPRVWQDSDGDRWDEQPDGSLKLRDKSPTMSDNLVLTRRHADEFYGPLSEVLADSEQVRHG